MKKLLAVICSLTALSLPMAAQAEAYIGANYTQLKQSNRFGTTGFQAGKSDFTTGEGFLRLGGVINKYVSSELRIGSTAAEKKQTVAGTKMTYRFDYNVGAYGKLSLPLGPVSLYSILGYTYGEDQLETCVPGALCSKNTSHMRDWSLGAGVDLHLGKHVGINAEFMQYYYIGKVDFRGPSAGIFYRF